MQDYSAKRVFGLDLLRALAILLVVFSSLYFLVSNTQGLVAQLISISGIIGIEIFFVLSGYLLGRKFYYLFLNKDFSFKSISKFWIHRWFRVLPNYYLALFINIGLALYLGLKLPSDTWQYFLFIQNFSWSLDSAFFFESWSISIGEFAVLLGPLLLYLLMLLKLNIEKSKLFLGITLAIIFIGICTKWIYSSQDEVKTMISWSSNLKTVVVYRIDAVYYGVLAAYISIMRPLFWKKVKFYTFLIGLLLFYFLFVYVPAKYWFIETHTHFWNVLYLPLCSIIITLMLPLLSQLRTVYYIIDKPVRFISSIAYAIYVIHYSIMIGLLSQLIPTYNLPIFDRIVYGVVYLSGLILTGYIISRWFEKPIALLRNYGKG
ncbi:acyltransferase family protein [Winogradskyella sp.]|uniref:acyltransferase family protein n=1 Tax=Winogradskyella sp. TaxID=1883156 RepID=UPI003F6B9B11